MSSRNLVKEAAASGQSIRGIHLTFAAPSVIEVLAAADLQFVYIDGEHGCFDWHDIEATCITAERHNLTPIARIPDLASATITRFLDRGVRGLVLPHVESTDDAAKAIDAAYFAPLGTRSFGAGRPEYGQRIGNRPAYMQDCNTALSVCAMIESQRGLDVAHDIAALRGIDYLSFGLLDLAQSLGHSGNSSHADVTSAVAACVDRIHRAGKRVREDFMNFVWINDVLITGARQLLDGAPRKPAPYGVSVATLGELPMIEQDVVVNTKYGRQPAFAACPDAPGAFPAVILYMDAPGFRDELRHMGRRIAKHGYFALVPDLYYRLGTIRFDVPRRNDAMSAVIRAAMQSLSNQAVMDDTAGMIAFLDGQEKVQPGPLGCVGHCMSGPFAVHAAARFPRMRAAASLYGVSLVTEQPDSPHRVLDRVKGELYIAFAEHDPSVPANVVPDLEHALKAADVRYRMETFKGVHHGYCFANRPDYDPVASEESWTRLFDLWERNLR